MEDTPRIISIFLFSAMEDSPIAGGLLSEPFIWRAEKIAVVFRFITLEIERWISNMFTIRVHTGLENGRYATSMPGIRVFALPPILS